MDKQRKNHTSPPDPIHEATRPPGQGELDEKALRRAIDALERAGAGH